MAPASAQTPPTAQIQRISCAEPSCPAKYPVVPKMPVPIMFETTSAVALATPSCRRSVPLGRPGYTCTEMDSFVFNVPFQYNRNERVLARHRKHKRRQ